MQRRFSMLFGVGLVALALLLPATAAAASGDRVFTGVLTGAAEVPAVQGDGVGSVIVIINAANTKITYVVTYRGLTGPVAASHIHFGDSSVSGPVIIPLKPGRSPMIGTLYAANLTPAGGIDTFAEAVAAIKAGNTYVNLHTAAHGSGEVRAQLKSHGDHVYSGGLSGAAEVPGVTSDGTGTAMVIINAAGTKIQYVVTYRGLSGAVAAAHIHIGGTTVSGPVIIPLKPGPTAMVGSLYPANLTPAGGINTFAEAVTAIKAGGTYINLHTAAHPPGEVRAQLR
jgi:hypothetical protein